MVRWSRDEAYWRAENWLGVCDRAQPHLLRRPAAAVRSAGTLALRWLLGRARGPERRVDARRARALRAAQDGRVRRGEGGQADARSECGPDGSLVCWLNFLPFGFENWLHHRHLSPFSADSSSHPNLPPNPPNRARFRQWANAILLRLPTSLTPAKHTDHPIPVNRKLLYPMRRRLLRGLTISSSSSSSSRSRTWPWMAPAPGAGAAGPASTPRSGSCEVKASARNGNNAVTQPNI